MLYHLKKILFAYMGCIIFTYNYSIIDVFVLFRASIRHVDVGKTKKEIFAVKIDTHTHIYV